MKTKFFLLFFFVSWILSNFSLSLAKILVIYRQDIETYQTLVNKFKKDYKLQLVECRLNNSCSTKNQKIDFIVALGDSAVKYAYQFKKPILAFFVSDFSLAYSCPSHKCLYYFLFPNCQQFLKELSNLVNNQTKVAILCSANSLSWIRNTDQKWPFKLSLEVVSSSEILDDLRKIFRKDYQIIILAPDLLFLQSKVLREIIKLSYTSKKLVIGFSSRMIDLGLPVVITYDYNQIYSIIPEIIENFEMDKYISFPVSILINEKVLNLFPQIKKHENFKGSIQ